jgi:hypothetical protein
MDKSTMCAADKKEPVTSEKKELTTAEIKEFLKKRAALAEEEKYGVVPAGGPKSGEEEVDRAHPEGGHDVSNLTAGTPIKDDGAKFETIVEQHDKDVEVAEKMPTGELNASAASKTSVKTAEVTKTAEADAETKKYWKEYFGQLGPEGKAFADGLVADFEKKTKAAVDESKGRIRRAYELAEEAAIKGMCDATTSAKMELVDKIVKFDDEAFLAFKGAVDKMPTRTGTVKTASVQTPVAKIPTVGQNEEALPGFNDFNDLSKLGWR